MIKKLVIFLIRLYQKTFSLDHGFLKDNYPLGYCKFRPTCSEYAIAAVSKKGVLPGLILAFLRICRCHPWSQGGDDPV